MQRLAPFLLLLLACAAHGAGFTVIKNVNSGEAPVDKLVIHGQGQIEDRVRLRGEGVTPLVEDGAIVAPIRGHEGWTVHVQWEGGGLPDTVDLHDYTYLVLRIGYPGTVSRTWNERANVIRRGNLWFTMAVLDKAGERGPGVNPATLTEDGRTPDGVVTLLVPTVLFTRHAYNDPSSTDALAFFVPNTRSNIDRDMNLVIEKISLAD